LVEVKIGRKENGGWMGVFPYGVGKIKGSTPKEVEMFVKSPVSSVW
jgi:hypothetical protein